MIVVGAAPPTGHQSWLHPSVAERLPPDTAV